MKQTPPHPSTIVGRAAMALVLVLLTAPSISCRTPQSNGESEEADPPSAAEQPLVAQSASANARAAMPNPPASAAPSSSPSLPGTMLGAMAFQTPIYPEAKFSDKRLGYIRQGGKVAVDPKPLKRGNCKEGWYRVLDGGYVCGKYSTLDLEHPRVRLGVKQPELEALVPYRYAYNRFHGTPLYKALPTKEEMLKYEPYLLEEKKKKEQAKEAAGAGGAGASEERRKGKHPVAEGADSPKEVLPGGAVPANQESGATDAIAAMRALDTGPPESPEEAQNQVKPWWQSDDKDPQVSLADLEQDADGNLAKRMVKGFFLAVDKEFGWNGRLWFRTTSGLVAPSDRMWINKPPESKGIVYPEKATAVFFVLGDKANKFEVNPDNTVKQAGKLKRFSAFGVTGQTKEIDGTTYRETLDGFWVKGSNGTLTNPSPRPDSVSDTERWVDVNLTSKTLLLFEGDKPLYAALISPGKRSRNKKKDHATPTGAWRIREKHVAVTMDGDGAAGDLPYSIDDVPYVMYFSGSYALHAAFWHNNFGREMSHGCVNLSPADAKHVFSFLEPALPRGWHAVWATTEKPGSMVVVHE